jgi:hypothetical protein
LYRLHRTGPSLPDSAEDPLLLLLLLDELDELEESSSAIA